jgi:hypothetical protein
VSRHLDQKRVLIAQEAARILSTQTNRDYMAAKKRAAERLGMDVKTGLPSNLEIEQALLEQQRLFSSGLDDDLHRLRSAAVEAMQVFERHYPRLAGPVLAGSAHADSIVELHLFADSPKDIVLTLIEHQIPYEGAERRFKLGREYEYYPVLRFDAGEASFELIVFPPNAIRQAPLSPVDGRPMKRASLDEVEALL